jgi:hypothetical protein
MTCFSSSAAVIPGLVPGIHAFVAMRFEDVDGRIKSGHDDGSMSCRLKKGAR